MHRTVSFILCAIAGLLATSAAADPQPVLAPKVPNKVTLKAEPFDLADVRLLDGPFRENLLRDKALLAGFDSDRLLHNFRVTAGLPSTAQHLGGWEAPGCQLRGHAAGHFLSACSLMYAATGDEALRAKANAFVAELAKCQEAMPSKGYNEGYLSAYPESLFDLVDAAKKVWAPYYTLHKIMAGLLDDYEHCGNPQALQVLDRMAGWVRLRVGRLSPEQMQVALQNEHGGIAEVLANLYADTGKPEYLKLAQAFHHQAILGPLSQGHDELDGLHANTQIPKLIGAAREYELTGDATLHEAAWFFWNRVALHRSWVIGGNSDDEKFFPIKDTARHMSQVTAETCNTYNMLKLTRHLFAWEPAGKEMDFYERGLFNHILGSQDPDTSMMTYYVSMKPGHFKVYCTPYDSFWCCTGTGWENPARYSEGIYFHGPDSLYVNLFIASTLHWPVPNVTVRQETNFPREGKTALTIHCPEPRPFALKLRQPVWAKDVTVSVNGERQKVTADYDSYLTLQRTWRDGDRIEYQFPMSLQVEELPNHPNVVSLLYGPIVLAGDMGTENLPGHGQEAKSQHDLDKTPGVPASTITCSRDEIITHIKKSPGPELAFQTEGLLQPGDLPLVPFYRLHHQRYTVYWELSKPVPAKTASK